MAERSAKRNEYVIDPLFEIPEGIDEFLYDEDTYSATESEVVFSDGDYDEGDFVGGDSDTSDGGALPVPENFSVVSQSLRTLPGGTQVVDVVVDVEDLPGVTEYEFRVVKV